MPPRKVSGEITISGMICSFSNPSAQSPRMNPNRAKVTEISARKPSAQNGWTVRSETNSRAVRKMIEAQDHGFGRRRADKAEQNFEGRDRRREDFIDRAGEARQINAERGVRDAFGQYAEEDQARHDKGAIAHAVDRLHPRADRRAEDDEVKRVDNTGAAMLWNRVRRERASSNR